MRGRLICLTLVSMRMLALAQMVVLDANGITEFLRREYRPAQDKLCSPDYDDVV